MSVPLGARHTSAWDAYAGHVRRYEPAELRDKLARAGFALERFEVRPPGMSKLAASVLAPLCRAFPRASVRVTESIFLPAACRQVLAWRDDPREWEARAAGAGECTLLCRRG
jgi:hypothetical protein